MGELIKQDSETVSTASSQKGCCTWKWCWWNPPQEAVTAEFFNQSSLHGLQYIGQPRRHITERAFWLVAFVIGLVAAGVLIYHMVDRYENTPVVVSFQSKEQTIDTIPFPAVTICNINQFSKKKVLELERISSLPNHEHFEEAKKNLTIVEEFCHSQKSFVQHHGFETTRGKPNLTDHSYFNNVQKYMLDFLVENSIRCDQMIPLCMFEGDKFECSKYFRPIVTEFGMCCSFNLMPLPLIFKNISNGKKKNTSILKNPALGTRLHWTNEEIDNWKLWNYGEGFILPHDYSFFYPFRQEGSGMPYGLSLLVDPFTDDYFCPMTDAEGMVFTLHTPIEIPDVRDFPSVLDTNKEIYIKITPDVTVADPDIKDLASKKRQCYFEKEKELKLFEPYTRENCVDECIASNIVKYCDCASFFMPREDGVRVCNTDVESDDGKCVDVVRDELRTYGRNHFCGHCLALCDDIDYNYEITMATLQNTSRIFGASGEKKPDWFGHQKLSILHFYFGTPVTVPKLRKRLYGITDLIANTGGILGLCLGFSALSAVELVYFVCVRAIWKYCYLRGCRSCNIRRKTTPELEPPILQDIKTIA